MSLSKAISNIESYTLDEHYYHLFESHLEHFKRSEKNRALDVQPGIADVYAGDFYGLLNHLRVDSHLHYLVMRMNNLYTSSDFLGDKLLIYIPDIGDVNSILSMYTSIEA